MPKSKNIGSFWPTKTLVFFRSLALRLPSRVKRRHNSITFDSSDGGHVYRCMPVCLSVVVLTIWNVCVRVCVCACVRLIFTSDHFDQCKCALYFRIEMESHVVYEQNNDSIPTPPQHPTAGTPPKGKRTDGGLRWQWYGAHQFKIRGIAGARNRNVLYIPKTI